MIISVLNIKGGVGKTTIATNLAVGLARRGAKTLLVDTDSQGSAMSWRAERAQEQAPVLVTAITQAEALRKQILPMSRDFDVLVIDGSPNVNALAAVSIAAADLILLPVGPSPLDIWATRKMVHQIEEAQAINPAIQAAFVINKFSTTTLLSKETAGVLQDLGLPTLQTRLGTRVSYADTMTQGLSVLEWTDRKAKAEIESMVGEVTVLCGLSLSSAASV